MVNFFPKLQDLSEKELEDGIGKHNPEFAILELNELMRRAVNKVVSAVENFNQQSSKQTAKMIWLTWSIVGLTVVMVVGLIIQIVLAVLQI